MIERATSPANIQAMLATLRAYQAQASVPLAPPDGPAGPAAASSPTGFTKMVTGAIQEVNAVQLQGRDLQSAYERGEPVQLTDVVLGMQKSSLAFEATLQIRNKVLKAYEDMMNMPV